MMLAGIFYLLSIVFANILILKFGVISVFGLMFPAGVVVIGLTFTLRDVVQRCYGKVYCWSWMISAMMISAAFNKDIAFASAFAFLISESADWCIFTFVRGSFKKRVILSNMIGTPLDSLIFVPLLFGWVWPVIVGQSIVKVVSSLLILPFVKK